MSSKISLNLEELTYMYETLHDRKVDDAGTKKQKKLCAKIMSTIEEEILKETPKEKKKDKKDD
jgi:hypothetical protein